MLQLDVSDWLTYRQAAERFGISVKAVQSAVHKKRIRVAHDPARGRNVVPPWEAEELWENRILRQSGRQRCKTCLMIKPLGEFGRCHSSKGEPYTMRSCKECWRPRQKKIRNRYQHSEKGQNTIRQWYQRKGGSSAYTRRKRFERRLNAEVI